MFKKDFIEIEKSLPDCFTMIANAMKAGLSLPQALQIASTDSPPALARVIRDLLERIKLGRSLEEALLASESQLKLPDFSLMVHSIITLRQIGGNFVIHFENLSHILRERQRVTEKVRLLTTQGLTQGVILGLMPFGLGFALCLLSPAFISPLWETPLGWVVLGLIILLDIGGWLWMRRLARVEV